MIKKKKVGIIIAVVCICLCGGLALAGYLFGQQTKNSPYIAENVMIADIDVSGMTKEEAQAVIDERIASTNKESFTLNAGKESVKATGSDFGITISNPKVVENAYKYGKEGNIIALLSSRKEIKSGQVHVVEMTYTADEEKIKSFINSKSTKLNVEPIDFSLIREDGEFKVVDGRNGIKVNVDESVTLLSELISDKKWDGKGFSTDLAVEEDLPDSSEEDLKKVKDVLGTFTTNFSSSTGGRATNIKVATGNINGTVLYPGEELSVSTQIKPRTAENGYQLASAYENGLTVDAYGGGICQVSTTLYNAVIRSELEVVERSPHSMVVSYVEPSMDAAISAGTKDFRFKNNQDIPIYIEGYTVGSNVTFTIYGHETRDKNREVIFTSEILSTTPVEGDVYVTDPETPAGVIKQLNAPHVGYVARLIKTVKVNGKEESRDVVNNSSYRKSNGIYGVGIAGADPGWIGAVEGAVSTQDRGYIEAVIGGAVPVY